MNKLLFPALALVSLGWHKYHSLHQQNFIAERVSRTATFIAAGPIDKVFPLFGPYEERKWAEGWNPAPVYPLTETMEEGMLFTTPSHMHGETESIWTLSQYQPANHRVQYSVVSPGRFLTITVVCSATSADRTTATVTYTFTGLNEEGNAISKHLLRKMYGRELKDWEEAINYYLKTGMQLRARQ